MKNILPIVTIGIAVLALVFSLGGETVIEKTEKVGAIASPDVYSYMNVHGALGYQEKTVDVAKTSIYSTSTLTVADSGTTYLLSASGTTMTLPTVSQEGVNFKFAVAGALDTGNVIIDSAEGDNIEGSLIVAGAVVDCNAVDQINFVVDGENIGDFVEVYSDGTHWLIGASGTLTASKMTCTDPS